ncbi:MAG: hypothetical protein Tsb002_19700 [Wenzhouxiangellaceae bacterium]
MRTHSCLFGAFMPMIVIGASILDSGLAQAATATVPTDFATVQQAIDAVQGTTDATVLIDSDGLFNESVTISDSLLLQPVAGRLPILQGTAASASTLTFNPTAAAVLTINNLHMRPPSMGNSGNQVIDIINASDVEVSASLSGLTIDDPDNTGAGALNIRVGFVNTGSNVVDFSNSTITLGGMPGQSTTAVTMLESGSLSISGLQLSIDGGDGEGFDIRGNRGVGIVFSLTDSTFTLDAPDGPFGSLVGRLLDNVNAEVVNNTFNLTKSNGIANASSNGLVVNPGGASSSVIVLQVSNNRFIGVGDPGGNAVSIAPFPNGLVELLMRDNLISRLDGGISLNPQSASAGATQPVAQALLLNNTCAEITDSCLRLSQGDGSLLDVEALNNLFTHTGQAAISLFDNPAASRLVVLDYNAYFDNGGGPVEPGLTIGSHALLADPLYRDLAAGDYRLRLGSPAIDRGDATPLALGTTDLDGNPRIIGATVDLGAFEAAGGVQAIAVPALSTWSLVMLTLVMLLPGWWSGWRSDCPAPTRPRDNG